MPTNRVFEMEGCDLSLYTRLATLSVTACQASRPEDRDEILRQIPDTAEFDAYLQALIFNERGLFSQRFAGFGILDAAARTARRVVAIEEAACHQHAQVSV